MGLAKEVLPLGKGLMGLAKEVLPLGKGLMGLAKEVLPLGKGLMGATVNPISPRGIVYALRLGSK